MPITDNQDELFDIVDERNQVIGSGTRKHVHAKGLRHRAVHILVKNSQNQVFVQLRSLSKDNNPGLWDTSAAGHVDAGESYLACAVREIKEELGIDIVESDLSLMQQRPATASNGYEFQHIYCVTSDAGITLQSEEVSDGKWLDRQTLSGWLAAEPDLFTEDFKDIWINALSGGFV